MRGLNLFASRELESAPQGIMLHQQCQQIVVSDRKICFRTFYFCEFHLHL